MRITRELLLSHVQRFIERQTRQDRTILSAYLCGSILSEEVLLGASGDIDLVLVHMDAVETARQILPLVENVHLDIQHHFHRDYRQPRQLRVHPWLGPDIHAAQILYDPQHFMDFNQASVRGQFNRDDFVVQRGRAFLSNARRDWSELAHPDQGLTVKPPVILGGPAQAAQYLQAVQDGANAIASLSGKPLSWRRFLLEFPKKAVAVDKPGLHAAVLGLGGFNNLDRAALPELLAAWQRAWESIPLEKLPLELHPLRLAYYRGAFQQIFEGNDPLALAWPLVYTWSLAAACLLESDPALAEWQSVFQRLGLAGESFAERLAGLDAFLDTVDEALEQWAARP